MHRMILHIIGMIIMLFMSMTSYANGILYAHNIENNTSSSNKINDEAIALLNKLTLEEKVAQMFIVVPEQLVEGFDNVTASGEVTKLAYNKIPVGGIIYMGNNIQNPQQTKAMLHNMTNISIERIGLPAFLCVDEEGGTVARVADNHSFDVKRFDNMSVIGSRKNSEEAFNIGLTIGGYLYDLGFNVDFAPVADIFTNSENTVIRRRSFGRDAATVSEMAASVSKGLRKAGILTSYKHFPGHGNTSADTHNGYAFTNKTESEIFACELIPFIEAIKNNEPIIMVGHISLPNIVGDSTPASLSKSIITDLLREKLGYKGLVVTDALNMGAICNQFTAQQASVKAVQAGADLILVPENFNKAYGGVLDSIRIGNISEERINESVMRIVEAKLKLNKRELYYGDCSQ